MALLTAALAGAIRVTTAGEGAPGGWKGLHVAGGRKGYADTPMGQVHYRVMGEGIPLLLLHQTPWFSVQFANVQPLLAAANVQSIAVDTPGFGFSDLPPEAPTIEAYADNLPYVLNALGIERSAVAGFHTGASIAAAFAHRHGSRTTCAVIDGAPFYTEEEREVRLARPHWDQTPKLDGSHLTDRYKHITSVINPNTVRADSVNWSVLSFFLAGETEHWGHLAAFKYDMAPAIEEIAVPTLIISHTGDMLHHTAARILKMRPDFRYAEFEGGDSQVIYDDPAPWAETVSKFVTEIHQTDS